MPELAIDPRTIGGAFDVDENARRIIHYRFAENVCMTSLGGWASSTPAIKLKFAFGEHCYQDSIHSFWLGQRLPELRQTENMDFQAPPTLRSSYVAEPPNDSHPIATPIGSGSCSTPPVTPSACAWKASRQT